MSSVEIVEPEPEEFSEQPVLAWKI